MTHAMPLVIRKHGNRRLYNTESGGYETVESLAVRAKRGDMFVVLDAKSGEDVTRAVLRLIVFAEEKKLGQDLLPVSLLRALICLHGRDMRDVASAFLEVSMDTLSRERDRKIESDRNAAPTA